METVNNSNEMWYVLILNIACQQNYNTWNVLICDAMPNIVLRLKWLVYMVKFTELIVVNKYIFCSTVVSSSTQLYIIF